MSTPSKPTGESESCENESGRLFKRLLYATDFSESAQQGLRFASELAGNMEGLLIIAHVEEPMETYAGGQFYGTDETIREQLVQSLETIVPPDSSVQYTHRYVTHVDGVAAGILETATAEKVDLIVIGTHGRTGLGRLLLGSVAEKVVRQATCPVLTFTPEALANKPAEGA